MLCYVIYQLYQNVKKTGINILYASSLCFGIVDPPLPIERHLTPPPNKVSILQWASTAPLSLVCIYKLLYYFIISYRLI